MFTFKHFFLLNFHCVTYSALCASVFTPVFVCKCVCVNQWFLYTCVCVVYTYYALLPPEASGCSRGNFHNLDPEQFASHRLRNWHWRLLTKPCARPIQIIRPWISIWKKYPEPLAADFHMRAILWACQFERHWAGWPRKRGLASVWERSPPYEVETEKRANILLLCFWGQSYQRSWCLSLS